MLACLNATKLYTAVQFTDAVKGNRDVSVQALLRQLDFSKRMVSGSRPIITNLIGKALISYGKKGTGQNILRAIPSW